jgi:hypothetical protein
MRTQRYLARPIALAVSLVGVLVLLESARTFAAPIIYTVDSTGDGGNTGSATTCNDGTGHCTLRAALEAANANAGADTISFALHPATDPNCDTATGLCTIHVTGALPSISEALEVHGPGADRLALRRVAGNFIRIFNVTATGIVSFSGLTITHAVLDPGSGAGIRNEGSGTVMVSNCVFTENEATRGCALANGPGTLIVTDCTMMNNRTSLPGAGAAIFNDGGTVTVARCTIRDNVGDSGGAIQNLSGTLTVLDSTISDNLAISRGGAFSNAGTLNVTNTTISGNRADSGGGVSNIGTASLTNCLIAGNSGKPGGGINNAGTLAVVNSTITDNQVEDDEGGTDDGGGIHNGQNASLLVSNCTITENPNGGGLSNEGDQANAIVKSCIIAQNGYGDVFGAIDSQGFNLSGDGFGGFSQPTDLTGTRGSPLDPMLDPNGLQDHGGPTRTIGLLCGSPAIDRGTRIGLNGLLVGDQRGFPRTFDDPSISNAAGGDGTDIGAFELEVACSDCDLTCPADISQGNAPDLCEAVVNIPAPTLTSSACPYSCSLSSGAFAVGTSSVTCETGKRQCSFDVTVRDTQKPTVTAPPGVNVSNDPGSCSATVDPGTATGNDNCPGVAVHGVRSDGQPLNAAYPVGTTTITWTTTDGSTNTSVPPALQTITVVDAEPPNLNNVTSSPSALWPPNHTMRDVTVDYTATDNCPLSACTLSVRSSEPEMGLGDGDTAPDWRIKDGHHEQLRAERSGLGNGRTYTTTVTCSDGLGNTTKKSVDVKVSHDRDGLARGSLFPAGAMVSFAGQFLDSPRLAHTGEWLFDSVRMPATIVAADSPDLWRVTASASFKSFGVYRVQMNVTDSSGQTGSTSMAGGLDANIVIYPSSGDYVAGAGWIDSPAGAYVPNRSLKGKGSFGFVSRSAHTATTGIAGETEFDLHLPGFRFNALNFDSQTVSGAKAQFRGTGTVNGAGSYGFVLTTTDGDQIGGVPDTFRIRIWSRATGATVYDNEMGSPDNADPVTPVGSMSSIVIQR